MLGVEIHLAASIEAFFRYGVYARAHKRDLLANSSAPSQCRLETGVDGCLLLSGFRMKPMHSQFVQDAQLR